MGPVSIHQYVVQDSTKTTLMGALNATTEAISLAASEGQNPEEIDGKFLSSPIACVFDKYFDENFDKHFDF